MGKQHRFNVSGNQGRTQLEGEDKRLSWRVYNGNVEVFWKGKMCTSKRVEPGDRICIYANNARTRIHIEKPPVDQIAKEAWKNGFYKIKRFQTLEELSKAAGNLKRRTYLGTKVSAGELFINQEKTVAIAYRKLTDNGQVVPFGWYASIDAKQGDVAKVISRAIEIMTFSEEAKHVTIGKVSCSVV
ncbi:MAG: hypothetical protein ACM3UU_00210 [Ignavibacteriales bacterium]